MEKKTTYWVGKLIDEIGEAKKNLDRAQREYDEIAEVLKTEMIRLIDDGNHVDVEGQEYAARLTLKYKRTFDDIAINTMQSILADRPEMFLNFFTPKTTFAKNQKAIDKLMNEEGLKETDPEKWQAREILQQYAKVEQMTPALTIVKKEGQKCHK